MMTPATRPSIGGGMDRSVHKAPGPGKPWLRRARFEGRDSPVLAVYAVSSIAMAVNGHHDE